MATAYLYIAEEAFGYSSDLWLSYKTGVGPKFQLCMLPQQLAPKENVEEFWVADYWGEGGLDPATPATIARDLEEFAEERGDRWNTKLSKSFINGALRALLRELQRSSQQEAFQRRFVHHELSETERRSQLLLWIPFVQGVRQFCMECPNLVHQLAPGASPCLLKLEALLRFELFVLTQAKGFEGSGFTGGKSIDAMHRHAILALLQWLDTILNETDGRDEWSRQFLGSRETELDEAIDAIPVQLGSSLGIPRSPSHPDSIQSPSECRRIQTYGRYLGRHLGDVELVNRFQDTMHSLGQAYAAAYNLPRMTAGVEAIDSLIAERTRTEHAARRCGTSTTDGSLLSRLDTRFKHTRRRTSEISRTFWSELGSVVHPAPRPVLLGLFFITFVIFPAVYFTKLCPPLADAIISLLLLLGLGFFGVGFVRLIFMRRRTPYVRVFPRLWGAVLIGYLPLVTESSLWLVLQELKPATVIAVILATTLVAWGYLYISIISRRVKDFDQALARATILTVVGLLQSVFVGLVISAGLGHWMTKAAMADRFEAASAGFVNIWFEGLFGAQWNFPAEPLIVWCPVAFFLGVVVQLLWQEKSVIDPV